MRITIGFLLVIAANCAAAGDEFDFDNENDSANDPASLERVIPLFDMMLRHDSVRDLPRPVEADFDRTLVRFRGGFDWLVGEAWTVRTTGRVHYSDDDNETVAFNLDNVRLRDAAVDEVHIDYSGTIFGLRLGQMQLMQPLSPMIWDSNLRLRGISLQLADQVQDPSHRFMASAGMIDHALGSDAEMLLLQWQQRFIASSGIFNMTVSGMSFDELDELPQARRTNTVTAGELATDFEIANLDVTYTASASTWPWKIGISLSRNTAADTEPDAARMDIVLGDAHSRGGFELGVAAQRVQADAVPAALNDADWWFPTRMRGQRLWLGYGWHSGWSMQLAAFNERVDPKDDAMRRLMLDVAYRF